jgi:carbamoyltransferase
MASIYPSVGVAGGTLPLDLWILGLNGPPIGWHDAAACLVDGDGAVWAMAEEERFTRVKHALHTYPRNAAQFCLDWVGIEPGDLDAIAIGWDLPMFDRR